MEIETGGEASSLSAKSGQWHDASSVEKNNNNNAPSPTLFALFTFSVTSKYRTHRTDHPVPRKLMIYTFQGRYIPALCDLAHVAAWEPHNMHDLAHVSWVGSVLAIQHMCTGVRSVQYRSCAASHASRLGSWLSRLCSVCWTCWLIEH